MKHDERLRKAKELNKQLKSNTIANRLSVQGADLSDEQLYSVRFIYPQWADLIGETITPETTPYIMHGDKFYRLQQQTVVQEHYRPDMEGMEAIYVEIHEPGTVADYDPDRNLAANPYQPGELMRWTDGHVYKSIHPDPHAWTPDEYAPAWELVE